MVLCQNVRASFFSRFIVNFSLPFFFPFHLPLLINVSFEKICRILRPYVVVLSPILYAALFGIPFSEQCFFTSTALFTHCSGLSSDSFFFRDPFAHQSLLPPRAFPPACNRSWLALAFGPFCFRPAHSSPIQVAVTIVAEYTIGPANSSHLHHYSYATFFLLHFLSPLFFFLLP